MTGIATMIHGFNEGEWNDYLESTGDEESRNRLEAHLIGCMQCWELYDRLAQVQLGLKGGGERLRSSLSVSDRKLHAGRQATMEKIDWAAPPRIQQKIETLAAVMAPMCGSRTAQQALRVAAEKSPARLIEQVTEDNWAPFMQRLRSIASVMCGETGAHLVWESGQL